MEYIKLVSTLEKMMLISRMHDLYDMSQWRDLCVSYVNFIEGNHDFVGFYESVVQNTEHLSPKELNDVYILLQRASTFAFLNRESNIREQIRNQKYLLDIWME